MELFLFLLPQALINGLIAGSLYSLIALGLNLVYGILRFVNFAHGDLAMVGAYLFYMAFAGADNCSGSVIIGCWGWPFLASLIFALVAAVVLNLLIERLTFRPVRNAPITIPLIISVGVSFFLQNLILLMFEGRSRSYIAAVPGFSFWDGQVYITYAQIAIVLLNIVLTAALFLFLKKAKIGKAIRAVSDNKEVAQILGVNVNRVVVTIFAIAGVLAAVAGIAAAFDQNFTNIFGVHLGIKAFAAIVLGGVGNLQGAVIGGLIIGLVENLLMLPMGPIEIPTAYKDVIAFAVIVVMLYIKPTGLLGAKQEEIIRK